MILFSGLLNGPFVEGWLTRMLTASWQGGLFLMLAFLICGCWKSLPAATRCWVWRLAYAKFVLVLFFGCFVNIPLIPVNVANNENISADNFERIAPERSQATSPSIPMIGKADAINTSSETATDPSYPAQSPASVSAEDSVSSKWVLALLFIVWLTVCVVSSILVLVQYFKTTCLAREGATIKHAGFLRQYQQLCHRLKLRRPPRVLMSQFSGSPMLVGSFNPVIVLPEKVVRSCDVEELKMILAHELAHAKRLDLLWNWLPTIVRSCFFFHPLVWLAQSRFSLDQEVACDYLALTTTNGRNSTYGNTLIKLASRSSSQQIPRLAAIGVASSFKTLRKRITEMSSFSKQKSRGVKMLSTCVLIAGVLAAAPIDLVAQKRVIVKQEKSSKASESKSQESSKKLSAPKPGESKKNEPATKDAKPRKKQKPKNLSVSVSEGETTKSLEVKSRTNGMVDVVFTKLVKGNKNVKKYVLRDFEKLAQMNKEAYEFYKEHVESEQGENQSDAEAKIMQLGNNKGQPKMKQPSNTLTQNSSGSSFESSTMTNINGVVKKTRNSGGTGGGADGFAGGAAGASRALMMKQINELIDKTDDPNAKDALRRMIETINKR